MFWDWKRPHHLNRPCDNKMHLRLCSQVCCCCRMPPSGTRRSWIPFRLNRPSVLEILHHWWTSICIWNYAPLHTASSNPIAHVSKEHRVDSQLQWTRIERQRIGDVKSLADSPVPCYESSAKMAEGHRLSDRSSSNPFFLIDHNNPFWDLIDT